VLKAALRTLFKEGNKMKKSKFSLNAFLIVMIIFSGMALLVTVKLTNMADRTAINSNNPIGDSNYFVLYSSLDENGIYRQDDNSSVLIAEGNFGYDWGAELEGNTLFINEYSNTDMGIMSSSIVKINLENGDKEALFENAMLRGKCKSGELVCVKGAAIPANYPETNSLYKLYNMSNNESESVSVIYLDSKTGKEVYRVNDVFGTERILETQYLQHTLEEVKG
jgi:hypothetical protein